MKKTALLSLAAAAAIAATAVGCGEKADSGVSSPQEETTAPTEGYYADPDDNIPDEKPTERVRNIEATTDLEYEVLDRGVIITKYTGSSRDVVIPDEIDGVAVVEIGFYAFEAKYDVRSVVVPETVTLIGECAFMDCASLETVNIPEAVTGIDRGAFAACTSLKEITIPSNVTYVREEAFTACESLTSLTINNPALAYESWGLEELPDLTVYAPEGSEVLQWAGETGIKTAVSGQ